jgi:hypothetical protein
MQSILVYRSIKPINDEGGIVMRKAIRILLVLSIVCMAIASFNLVAYAQSPPTVTGVSPGHGSTNGGDSVTITGTGFTGASAVDFSSTAASFTIDSDTQITATSPAASEIGTANVTVTNGGGTSSTSSSDQFTYTAPGYYGMNTTPAADVMSTTLHGFDQGDLIFSMGDSQYKAVFGPGVTDTVHYTVSGIPSTASIVYARLYAYYTWSNNNSSQQGVPADLTMTMNGTSVSELNDYSDQKGVGSWNYPNGMVSFDATSSISGNGTYTAVLTNAYPTGSSKVIAAYGIGLMIIYQDSSAGWIEYWVNEGADLIYPYGGITPAEATTNTSFSPSISSPNLGKVLEADLTTVVPGGRYGNNQLTFNSGGPWTGVYAGGSTCQLGVDANRDVTGSLSTSNSATIQSSATGSQSKDFMIPGNAFLVVHYSSEPS